MHGTTTEGQCFLCGSHAGQTTGLMDEGVIYTCHNDACGRYFLSNQAKNTAERHPALYDLKSFSNLAREAKERDQWLCLRVNPTSGLIDAKIAAKC
jgi:hypothetical protein